MVNIPGSGLPEDRRVPATTLEGWRRPAGQDPVVFGLLPLQERPGPGPRARDEHDEGRVSYHSELITAETPAIRQVLHQGRLLTLMSRREISARRGLIVSGPRATGKSAAIKQPGRAHELRARQRFPGGGRIPAACVPAPPGGSPRKLATRFARFPGLPLKSRHNETDIADAACEILAGARCDLVLADEIRDISMSAATGKDLPGHLKCLAGHIPAAFAYAGISVERGGLSTGVRGKQIAARCVMRYTASFPCRAGWLSMTAAMEHSLRLCHHKPRSLAREAKYLRARTGGSTSSLSRLIRAAAISAIAGGSERITRRLPETAPADRNTQSGNPGRAGPDGNGGAGDAA